MLVDINKVKVNERIRKDFGDIAELANDIKENGLINPPVVTPDYELIAGERRLRAMKSLGYEQIEVRIMTVQDALHQLKLEISENENRKDFTFSEKMKWADQLKAEYEKIAKANQGSRTDLTSCKHLQEVGLIRDKLASDLDLGSGEQYRKADYIYQNATEEQIKKLDENKLSINAVYRDLKEKNAKLAVENTKLKVQLDNPDLKIINTVDKNKIEELEQTIERLTRDKNLLERKAKFNEQEAEQYQKLKSDMEFLTKQKTDLSRQITAANELSGLTVRLQQMLEKELAPIKYKRCMEILDDDITIQNLNDIVAMVQKWVDEITTYIPNNLRKDNVIWTTETK